MGIQVQWLTPAVHRSLKLLLVVSVRCAWTLAPRRITRGLHHERRGRCIRCSRRSRLFETGLDGRSFLAVGVLRRLRRRWLFSCGARGFLTKSESKSEIATAARKVLAGKLYISRPVRHNLQVLPDFELDQIFKRMSWLSPREIRVLSRLRKGFRNKDMARAFDVNEKTIKAQMTSTMRKLDVNNRTQAASAFSSMGFEQLVSQLFLDY